MKTKIGTKYRILKFNSFRYCDNLPIPSRIDIEDKWIEIFPKLPKITHKHKYTIVLKGKYHWYYLFSVPELNAWAVWFSIDNLDDCDFEVIQPNYSKIWRNLCQNIK